MKKYIVALLASFACMQSVQAIPSNLGQSLLEYAAIENSSLLQDVIPQSEFIVDIQRKTRDISASEAIYFIKTLASEVEAPVAVDKKCHRRDGRNYNLYRVHITLTPNPELGPPVITVDSITQVQHRYHRHSD